MAASRDANMEAAIRDNISINLALFTQRETEYRNLARYATVAADRRTYLQHADIYRRNIANINVELRAIDGHREPIRPVQSFVSRINQAIAPVQQPAQPAEIASSTPLKIPPRLPTDVPSQFMCPITMEIMTDPVMLTDGQVYERKAIVKWLETNSKSPLTNIPIQKDIVIPCFVLRNLMQEYFSKLSTEPSAQQPASQKKKREPTRYNLFVKERMSILKAQHPELLAKDIMKLIGAEWKASKQ